MKNKISKGLLILLSFLLVLSSSISIMAENSSTIFLENKLDFGNAKTLSDKGENIICDLGNTQYVISKDAGDSISIQSDKYDYSIISSDESLRNAGINNDYVTFESDKYYKKRIEVNEFGLMNLNIINNEQATEIYKYEFELPEGAYLKELSLDGQSDGSIGIFDENNNYMDGFIVIQPTDSHKKLVPMNYYIDGNSIIQKVLHKDNMVSYPIETGIQTASSTSFSTYFQSSFWITRDSKLSLSVTIKDSGWQTSQGSVGMALIISDSWNILKNRHQSSSYWSNTNGMKDQYECHANYAFNKRPWNLETWRPDVSYAATVAAGCNP